MKGLICDQFQKAVEESLIRNNDLLDILSKLQQTSSKTNRAVVKAITSCGCVGLNIEPQEIASENYESLKTVHSNSVSGDLCPACKEKIVSELGNQLFYIAALCNNFDLDMFDIIIKEYDRLNTLGKYNLY